MHTLLRPAHPSGAACPSSAGYGRGVVNAAGGSVPTCRGASSARLCDSENTDPSVSPPGFHLRRRGMSQCCAASS